MAVRELLTGPVSVTEVRCDLKPGDAPFAGVHRELTIAYVQRGSFAYHANGHVAELVTGSAVIGQPGTEYRCTHEDSYGDVCLAFSFTGAVADTFEHASVLRSVDSVPPIAELVVLGELAQAAADRRSDLGLDEIALFFAGRAIEVLSSDRAHVLRARARDRSRAIGATYWIDAHLNEEVSLERLAREAGLSPFYFLRLFVGVLGLTPHQYLLRARLREAARLLADGATPVTEVAGDVGFGDLSNFVRTFGKAARMSPGHFRKLARAKSKILQEPEPATV